MTLTNQQYRDIYKKLSKEKRVVISSPELSEITNEISKSYNFDKQKKDSVAFVVKDLLYEIYSIPEAKSKLISFGIDDQTSQKIVDNISKKIINNLGNIYQTIQINTEKENIANGVEDYEIPEEENDKNNWFSALPDDRKSEIKLNLSIFKHHQL